MASDTTTPCVRPGSHADRLEETLSALTDLVRQGKVRYVGSSTFPASQIVEAQWVARDRNLQRFFTEQPPYSILPAADSGLSADVLDRIDQIVTSCTLINPADSSYTTQNSNHPPADVPDCPDAHPEWVEHLGTTVLGAAREPNCRAKR